MAWFKKTRRPIARRRAKTPSRVPEGMWKKCPGCSQALYNKDLEVNLGVCPKCSHHFRLTAAERLRSMLDGGNWTEHFTELTSKDPLAFEDIKRYSDRLRDARSATGLNDAVIVATGVSTALM